MSHPHPRSANPLLWTALAVLGVWGVGPLAQPGLLHASEDLPPSPLAEMRAAAIAAAEVEPELRVQRPPVLPATARRDFLREVVRGELIREQHSAAHGAVPPGLRRAEANASGESKSSTGSGTVREEAVAAQGAERARTVANGRGEETGAGKPETPPGKPVKPGKPESGSPIKTDAAILGRAAALSTRGGGGAR